MLLGKVVGTLVATQKDEKLEGFKFLVVKRLNIENQEMGDYVIAADAVQAGVGDVVMYASGSSARQTVITDKKPCDAVIMAIVDTWEVQGEVKYQNLNFVRN
jgi:microcompartment protein CcmK/EutM